MFFLGCENSFTTCKTVNGGPLRSAARNCLPYDQLQKIVNKHCVNLRWLWALMGQPYQWWYYNGITQQNYPTNIRHVALTLGNLTKRISLALRGFSHCAQPLGNGRESSNMQNQQIRFLALTFKNNHRANTYKHHLRSHENILSPG